MLNKLQKAGFELMQSDARFIYTFVDIFETAKNIDSNYMSMCLPYIGVFADGAEQWCKKVGLDAPRFNDEEKEYDTLTFDTPHRRMELSETANLYLQALNKLPYTWQRILLMRGEEEKSYAEIAEILGTSDSSVRATLCKAKKKIMQYLNHDL